MAGNHYTCRGSVADVDAWRLQQGTPAVIAGELAGSGTFSCSFQPRKSELVRISRRQTDFCRPSRGRTFRNERQMIHCDAVDADVFAVFDLDHFLTAVLPKPGGLFVDIGMRNGSLGGLPT